MDEIKQKGYNILLEIDRICKEADLHYYIYAGTLLGAVRHGGFIPWDDDIDIVMMREDYEKFPAACDIFLDRERYALQTIHSDPVCNNPWMKLHDRNTAFISNIRRDGAMEGVNVDIFPVDNAPDDNDVLNKRARYFDRMNLVYQWRFAQRFKKAGWRMMIFQPLIHMIPPLDEKKFKIKYDKRIQEYNSQNTERVVYFSNRKYLKKVVGREVFADTVMMRFEDGMFPAPVGWKTVLESLYGKDYMQLPPKEQQTTVHGTAVIDLNNSWTEYRRGKNGYEKI